MTSAFLTSADYYRGILLFLLFITSDILVNNTWQLWTSAKVIVIITWAQQSYCHWFLGEIALQKKMGSVIIFLLNLH